MLNESTSENLQVQAEQTFQGMSQILNDVEQFIED